MQPSELAGENTILLNVGHCFRDQVLESCPELNRADAHVPRTNSLETVRNMVASGLGISVLPRDALTPKYHSRMVVPVPFAQPAPSRRVALAYRRSFPRPAAIAALREVGRRRAAVPRRNRPTNETDPRLGRPVHYRTNGANDPRISRARSSLITGASTGIGAAAARAFARGGQRGSSCITTRAASAAEKVVADIKAAGGEGACWSAATSCVEADVKRIVAETLARVRRRIDVLINNAGGMLGRVKIEDYTVEHIHRVLALNCTQVALFMREACRSCASRSPATSST